MEDMLTGLFPLIAETDGSFCFAAEIGRGSNDAIGRGPTPTPTPTPTPPPANGAVVKELVTTSAIGDRVIAKAAGYVWIVRNEPPFSFH